jgi:S1-C subfamily serine protease
MNLIKRIPVSDRNVVISVLFGAGLLTALFALALFSSSPSNPVSSTVKVVDPSMHSGGTGVTLTSSSTQSTVLTNGHVCHVIENGGYVINDTGTHTIATYQASQQHDLCMITVNSNLGASTTIASSRPTPFTPATISGHPALLPTVVTTGHFSNSEIITVMTGSRECTEEDKQDPSMGFLCLFLGRVPVIKSYESTLVTALIQPGSSGSGVYNDKNELVGLVFAGKGGIGYAWTVPYASLMNFIYDESRTLPRVRVGAFDVNQVAIRSSFSDYVKQFRQYCNNNVGTKLCNIVDSNLLWTQ